ncbi:hypothetical protein SANTM175S_11044 [Streptomyces antimycoticus]
MAKSIRGVNPAASHTSTRLPAAARAARDPGLAGELGASGSGRRRRRAVCPSGTTPAPAGSVEQRAQDEVVPLASKHSSRIVRIAEGERDVAVARAQQLHGAAAARPPPARPGCRDAPHAGAASAMGTRVELPLGKDTSRTRPGPQPGDRGDLLLGGGRARRGSRRRAAPAPRPACGQAHLPPAADQQRGARGALQGLHLLADGGLGAAQLTGGGGEGAGGGDGAQHPEMAGLDHASEHKRPLGMGRDTTSTL